LPLIPKSIAFDHGTISTSMVDEGITADRVPYELVAIEHVSPAMHAEIVLPERVQLNDLLIPFSQTFQERAKKRASLWIMGQ
jgi:hypothetical protein